MKDEDISLDFIDELIARDAANKKLLEMAETLKLEGELAQQLCEERELLEKDAAEGSLSAFRRAQKRAEGLLEKILRLRLR